MPWLTATKPVLPTISPMTAVALGLTIVFLLACLGTTYRGIRPGLVFAWNCFVKPVLKMVSGGDKGSKDGAHQDRLEEFYAGQAGWYLPSFRYRKPWPVSSLSQHSTLPGIYDITRKRLLRGRTTMLKLCAAQLRQHYPVKGAGESPASLAEFILKQQAKGGSRSPEVVATKNETNKEVERKSVEGEKLRLNMATPPASPRLGPGSGSPGGPNSNKKVVWVEIGGGWVIFASEAMCGLEIGQVF